MGKYFDFDAWLNQRIFNDRTVMFDRKKVELDRAVKSRGGPTILPGDSISEKERQERLEEFVEDQRNIEKLLRSYAQVIYKQARKDTEERPLRDVENIDLEIAAFSYDEAVGPASAYYYRYIKKRKKGAGS